MNSIISAEQRDRQLAVGATADQFAREGVFEDYQARRAKNTLRRQFQAKELSAEQHALIRTVSGFQFKEQKRTNEKSTAAGVANRKGVKKAAG